MAAQLIDGKAIAQEVRAEVKREVADWVAEGHEAPGLATVLVGDDPASALYVGNKQKASAEVGIQGFDHRLPQDAPHDEVEGILRDLAVDPRVSGILLQLPTPPQVDGAGLAAQIPPGKDVDGLTPLSAGLLAQGRRGLRPCTPSGIMELLRRHDVPIQGAEAVVVGRSDLVGRPVSALLLAANATVTVCHSKTRDLGEVCRRADILVAAVGRPGLVKGEWIKPGATVIDVGSPKGDVEFEAAAEHAGLITPCPRRRRPDDDRDAAAQHAARRPRRRRGAGGGRVELSRLRPGELIAAAGGVALLVVMFLEWYAAGGTTKVAGRDITISVGFTAWEAFGITDILLALAALIAIGLAVLTATRRSPALPVAASVITATTGILATLLVLYRILNQPGPNEFIEVKLPAFLGFLCVLAIAAGGWRSMRDESWEDAPVPTDVRPAPPAEGPREPAPPPEAEPRA